MIFFYVKAPFAGSAWHSKKNLLTVVLIMYFVKMMMSMPIVTDNYLIYVVDVTHSISELRRNSEVKTTRISIRRNMSKVRS